MTLEKAEPALWRSRVLSHSLIAWGSYCRDPQRLSALSVANIIFLKNLILSRYESEFRSDFLGCLCSS